MEADEDLSEEEEKKSKTKAKVLQYWYIETHDSVVCIAVLVFWPNANSLPWRCTRESTNEFLLIFWSEISISILSFELVHVPVPTFSESCIGSMYVIQTLGPKALLFSVSSVIFCYYSTDCLVITKQRLLHFVL